MPRYVVQIVRGSTVLVLENALDVVGHEAASETAADIVRRLVRAADHGGPDFRGAVLEAISEDGRRTCCVPFPPLPKAAPRSRIATAVYGIVSAEIETTLPDARG